MFNIIQYLKCMFPKSKSSREHFYELLTEYQYSGLAPPHLLQEIETEDAQKLWATIWEAMLYGHFANRGFQFREDRVSAAGQNGPDLGLIHHGRTIWIEAVVPKPEGLPPDWLAPLSPPGEFRVRTTPDVEMLLRWTSVLRDKNTQRKRRLENNVVGHDEIYVVAINSYMLSWFPVEDEGITGLPFAVEVVFPIGPLTISFERTKDGPRAGTAEHAFRSSMVKPSTGAPVPTDNFFDREYDGISALIGCSRNEMMHGNSYLIVVHNPLARNRLPSDLLGAHEEYVTERDGDRLTITKNHVR